MLTKFLVGAPVICFSIFTLEVKDEKTVFLFIRPTEILKGMVISKIEEDK
ncbi:MAG: hypothetical protein HeimC3_50150 [Candidatus Heimdallarchaeota archaeon LC_3]|nr:MAG: hypothetical protein HeimC3_50150 [Candidatus Heimdallarchaeota archaeon LC_3]